MDKEKENLRRFSVIKPRYVIIFGLVISLVMIVSSYIEYSENKHEIYHLLDEHANSIIFAIDKSSANTIISEKEIENLLSQHLLGVARNIYRLDSVSFLSNELLVKIAEENEIFRINVFNEAGVKEYSNMVQGTMHSQEKGKYSPRDFIDSVLNGKVKEMIIGLKSARMEKGTRYAVAVSRPQNRKGAIVVNLDAETFLEFKKKIGFEKTISDIGKKSGIEYIVLQNEKEIITSDKQSLEMSKFNDDVFLHNAFARDSVASRVINFGDKNVYEIVKSFVVENEKIGLFRVGLSMEEINLLENKMMWRGGIISLVIIVISVIVIAVVVSNQNYKMVSEEFIKIQTFTGEILANMTQAVITINKDDEIEIFNKKAEEIFFLDSEKTVGKKYSNVLRNFKDIFEIIDTKKEVNNCEIILNIEGKEGRTLSINSTVIFDEDNRISAFTIVIDDITEARNNERQIHQNEKLIAMGELASGVAHEVRNPLNSINMIAQRFEKEYSDKLKSEEFDTLSDVLKNESSRVNNIVEQFLKFARPPKLNITEVSAKDFLSEIKSITEINANEKGIIIDYNIERDGNLNIDIEQMKQVFINLIQNSIDANSSGGDINIVFKIKSGKNIFEISDSGIGIPKENLNKIFNIYFTTKTKGTGLGLSIVQQIISRHNGNIYAESNEGSRTKFIIEL
ncbi:MAG: ATP-binding protein [Ignavibacteria bacterium]|jgi:PAS domain S-box-containing protein